MSTRLSQFCDRVIEAGWLAVAIVVPVFFNIFGHRIFELPKVTMLRSLVAVMVLAWAVKAVEESAWRAAPGSEGELGVSSVRRWLARPMVLPVLSLALVYLVATAFSVVPAVSFWGLYERMQGTVTTLSYLALFLLVAFHLRTREQFHRLVSASLAVSFVISVYAVMQHLGADPVRWSADISGRVIGTMGNPIFLAAYLIMVVPFTLARLVAALRPLASGGGQARRQPLPAAAYVLLLAAQLVAILFTNSRGPWLGLLAAVAMLAILLPLRLRLWRTLAAVGGTIAVLGLLLVIVNVPRGPLEGLKARSTYLERLGSLNSGEGSIKGRLLILRGDGNASGILGLITAEPARAVIGYGPETLFFTFGPFLPAELTQSGGAPSSPGRAHSDLLDYVVTTGVLGLIAYLAVLVVFYRSGIRYLWRTRDFYQQLFGLALVAAVTGHLVETFVGIAVTATQTQFWLYLGAMAALISTDWQAKPAIEPTVATAVPAGKKRNKQTRRSQTAIRNASPLLASLFVFYVLATVFITASLLLGGRFSWPPWAAVAVGFLWVVLGVVVAAACLRREGGSLASWRAQRWWAYLLLLGGAAMVLSLLLRPLVADIFFKMGQVSTARQQYQQGVLAHLAAISYTPGEDLYYLVLGRTFRDMASAAPPGTKTGGIASMADLYAIGTWTDLGRDDLLDAGQVVLERAQRINSLKTDNWTNLAELHRSRAALVSEPEVKRREVELTVEAYQQAVKLAPNASYVYYGLGTAYHWLEDYDNAITSYRRAVELGDKSARINEVLGRALAARGDLDEAASRFLIALDIDPRDWTVRRRLAQVYWDQRQADRAIAEMEAAIKLAGSLDRPSLQEVLAEWKSKVSQ